MPAPFLYDGEGIPDAIELKGIRGWHVRFEGSFNSLLENLDNPRLASVYWGTFWAPGWNKAVCLRTDGIRHFPHLTIIYNTTNTTNTTMGIEFVSHPEPPAAECECGFYALHIPKNIKIPGVGDSHISQHIIQYTVDVLGLVEAKGRVLTGSLGWRAEYARVIELWKTLPSLYNDEKVRLNSGMDLSHYAWGKILELLAEYYQVPLVDKLNPQRGTYIDD